VAKLSDDKIDRFRPQLRNANKHTQRGTGMLEASMRKYGYVAPMTAAADGEIIDGSARIETSAGVFGDDVLVIHHDGTKPVIMVRDDIPNADTPEAREISIAANRIAQVNLDFDAEQILEDLQAGVDLGQFWRKDELDEMLADLQPKTTGDTEAQVDRAEELRQKWQTSAGQLWQLGDHRLIVGDCTDPATVARVMGGDVAALAPVDPPYNVGFDYDGSTVDDSKAAAAYEEFSRAWFGVCQSVSVRQIVTPGCNNLASWLRWFDAKHWAPWTKTNSMTNGVVSRFWCWEPVLFFGEKWPRRRANDVFNYPIGQQAGVANHPCPKPLAMWLDLVENYSDVGDVVYESFNGSGTTIIACENLGRKCRACEISPAYVAVALERWSTHTGRVPVLVAA
jgi:DNA modification methylase